MGPKRAYVQVYLPRIDSLSVQTMQTSPTFDPIHCCFGTNDNNPTSL